MITSITILVVGVILALTGFSILVGIKEKKARYGKHHCNQCKCSFILTKRELQYISCPYCGTELTYYQPYMENQNGRKAEENERTKENVDIEDSRRELPFNEFSDRGNENV